MPNDALTYCHIARELDQTLRGGKINRITMPDKDTVVLVVRASNQNHQLLLCASSTSPRAHLSSATHGNVSNPFLLHLRKHIDGGIITGITALPFERVLQIAITARDDLKVESSKTLVVEIISRSSNILLVGEQGIITDCLRKRALDSDRPALPSLAYQPPIQDKQTLQSLTQLPSDPKLLMASVKGISLPLARYAIQNSLTPKQLSDLFDAPTQACLVTDGDRLTDFWCFVPPGATIKAMPTLSQAMETFFAQTQAQTTQIQLEQRATSLIASARAKATKTLDLLISRQASCQNAEQERHYGDLLLANIYKIKYGDRTAVVDDYISGETVTIKLDPKLSPSQNAQGYYKRFGKKTRTLEAIAPQLAETRARLDYLDRLQAKAKLTDPTTLALIIDELSQTQSSSSKTTQKSQPRQFEIEGFQLLVGRNNAQNDALVRSAKPMDIWLHIKNATSCHGILVTDRRVVPTHVIERAAAIIVKMTQGVNSAKTPVDYTEARYVVKPKGSAPGKVTYTHQKTIWVCDDQ